MELLFVCGGGASSSFIAQNVQRAANDLGEDVTVEAISETELEDYIEDKDLVLIGPHLKYLEEDLSEVANHYGVPYEFISDIDYAKMDGKSILIKALKIIELE